MQHPGHEKNSPALNGPAQKLNSVAPGPSAMAHQTSSEKVPMLG